MIRRSREENIKFPEYKYLSIAIALSVTLWSQEDIGLEIMPVLQWILIFLSKTAITLKQNAKFAKLFFISHLAVLRPTLDHWQGGSFTQPMLIRTLFQVWPEDHWEPRNETGSQTLTSALVGFEPETFRFWV